MSHLTIYLLLNGVNVVAGHLQPSNSSLKPLKKAYIFHGHPSPGVYLYIGKYLHSGGGLASNVIVVGDLKGEGEKRV